MVAYPPIGQLLLALRDMSCVVPCPREIWRIHVCSRPAGTEGIVQDERLQYSPNPRKTTRPKARVGWAMAVGLAGWLALAAEVPEPETTAPAGAYQVAWLALEKGWEKGRDAALFLGLRDGQATAVWLCGPERTDAHRLWPDELRISLAGDILKGEVKGRMAKLWGPMAHVGDYAYSIQAQANGGQLSGTFTARFALKEQKEQTVTGTLAGTLAGETQLLKAHGLPEGKDWPGYYGVGFAFRGPDCAAAMIDDLGAARPLWKAEEPLPCMWGKGPDARYKLRACVTGVDGGASSPVVAGGLAYVFYFRPAGPLPSGEKAPTEGQLRAEAAKFTSNPLSHQAYVEWHRPLADDIVVAFDAATGKTVWKTVLKERGINHQTHKWRGFNPTPFVARGVVYVANYANRLYALDARTGKLLWEHARGAKQFTATAAGPVVADGVVVAALGETVGLDPRTGQELWKAPGSNLLVWTSGGRQRLTVLRENRTKDPAGGRDIVSVLVACLEPKTGKELWRAETPLWSPRDVGPLVEGDLLLGCTATKGEKPGEADFGKDTQVVCYRLKDDGLEKLWAVPAPYPAVDKIALTVANGCVYAAGSQETFCLKLDTGERLGVAKAGGARTQLLFAADGRVFIQPEGRHGGQAFFMLEGNPGAFRVLEATGGGSVKHPGAGQWVPPHVHDTAYANHPVGYPLVDGRLFVRGHDGLYCYDLRRAGR